MFFMNKRRVFVLFFVFVLVAGLFLSSFNLTSAVDTSGIEDSAERIQDRAEDANEKIEKAEEVADDLGKKKWDYLGKEWGKIFLSNKYIAWFNGLLGSISI